jgi:sialate O-acetylesterase
VVWYQGESNAGRAYEYNYLFPLMIQHWRDEWKQGDFSFYWVQLADFKPEQPDPGDSDWAELREAQTKTMGLLKNTGQAVITDLGEANDIHPRNKRDVAERLARWALVKDYSLKMPYRSPELKSMEVQANKAVVSVDCFGSTLRTVDVGEARGFAICGEDKKWVWADAKIMGPDKIEVSSKQVAKPLAVRYAWADNPVCNVYSKEGLPLTPFRTDDFPLMSKVNSEKAAAAQKEAATRKQQVSPDAGSRKPGGEEIGRAWTWMRPHNRLPNASRGGYLSRCAFFWSLSRGWTASSGMWRRWRIFFWPDTMSCTSRTRMCAARTD